MNSPYKKKRKLHDDDNLRTNTTDNQPTGMADEDEDWANDDMGILLTQQENLNRIDSFIASSQAVQKQTVHQQTIQKQEVKKQVVLQQVVPKQVSHNNSFENARILAHPPIISDSEIIRQLKEKAENLQQQLYSKDGQVKFLNDSNNKFKIKLQNQTNDSAKALCEQAEKFNKERTNLRSEIKSMKVQLDFTQHEINKSSYSSPRPQLNNFQSRTKSTGDSTSPLPPKPSFLCRDEFLSKPKISTIETSCQTGPEDDGFHMKTWKLKGKNNSKLKSAFVGGVLSLHTSMRHYANQLEFGNHGCQQNNQICRLKDQLKYSDYLKHLSGERVVKMYHELISKKVLVSTVEILHRSTIYGPPSTLGRPRDCPEGEALALSSSMGPGARATLSSRESHVHMNFSNFLEDVTHELRTYLNNLLRQKQLSSASSSECPQLPRNKRRYRVRQKPVSPIADILATVHSIVTVFGANEYKQLYKMAFFREFQSIIVDLANKDSLEDEFEITMMCLHIINSSLRYTEPKNMGSFKQLLEDEDCLILRILKHEDHLEKPSEGHGLVALLVFEIITSLSNYELFTTNTCKEINTECILKLTCSFMTRFRSKSSPILPYLLKQFYCMVGILLLMRLKDNKDESSSSCDCVVKSYHELLQGMGDLEEFLEKDCTSAQMNVVRGGMSIVSLMVDKFPWTFNSKKAFLLSVTSGFQNIFGRFQEVLTEERDYKVLLALTGRISIETKGIDTSITDAAVM